MPSHVKTAKEELSCEGLARELFDILEARSAIEQSIDGVSPLDALQKALEHLGPAFPTGELTPSEYATLKGYLLASIDYQMRQAYRRSFRRKRTLARYPVDGPGPDANPDALQCLMQREMIALVFRQLADDPAASKLLKLTLPKIDSRFPQIEYKDTAALAAHFNCRTSDITNIKKRVVRAAKRALSDSQDLES